MAQSVDFIESVSGGKDDVVDVFEGAQNGENVARKLPDVVLCGLNAEVQHHTSKLLWRAWTCVSFELQLKNYFRLMEI